jgi:branched-subunit amino acid transport protein
MKIYLIIVAMMLVTYIPRAIPAILIDKMRWGKKAEKFLSLTPYTAMAALIVPGVLSVDANHLSVGIAGALIALLLSWKKAPIVIVIIGAVSADIALYLFL